jgi:hypothetical protein
MAAPLYSLTVDWDNNTIVTGASAEDVTDDVLNQGRWTYGYGRDQNRQLSPSSIGNSAFTLCNAHRIYSPENTASPLVDDLGPGRPVAMDVTISGVDHPLFRGRIDDFDIHPDRSDRTADFTALDGLADLSNADLSTALYSGLRTGQIVDVILDEIGWTGARDIDAGATYARFWWAENTDALTAINDIVAAEGPPAIAYIAPDGTFTFRDRHHRIVRTESITPQAVFAAEQVTCDAPAVTGYSYTAPFEYRHGWRDVVNTVDQEVSDRATTFDTSVVWSTDGIFTLSIGETREIRVQASDPFRDAVTPVRGTDFTTSGTGVVSAVLTRTSGQSTVIRLTSVGGPSSILSLQLRARPVSVERTVRVRVSDPGSIGTFGTKSFPNTIPYASPADVQAVAETIVAAYSSRRPIVRMRVVSCDIPHLQQIVTRTISDMLTIRNGELGLDAEFHVESVAHTITRIPGDADCDDYVPVHSVVFGCEKVLDDCAPNPFTFDKTGAGFNDGTFDAIGCSSPDTVWIWDAQSKFNQNNFGV